MIKNLRRRYTKRFNASQQKLMNLRWGLQYTYQYKVKEDMLVAKIFSVLGNPQSLVPLAIKDSANIAGMTGASAVTSKEEARDRLIDEVGTGAVWLGAIPLYKKVVDKTVFKVAGYDANYDVRNLKDEKVFEQTKKYAPTEEIKSKIEKIGANKKVFKGLNAAKFVLATGGALATYNIITDMKQKYTHN